MQEEACQINRLLAQDWSDFQKSSRQLRCYFFN
jgi:hypothetical protein